MNCIGDAFQSYFSETPTVDRIESLGSAAVSPYPSYVNLENRSPDLDDIRNALDQGNPVIVSVSWEKYNAVTQVWTRTGGHEFVVYGYDWEAYWLNNMLNMDIMNPESSALFDPNASRYSSVMAIKHTESSPDSSIFMDSASGFTGNGDRAFLHTLTIIHVPTASAVTMSPCSCTTAPILRNAFK